MLSASTVDWLSIPNALDHTSYFANKGNLKLQFMISIMLMSEFLCGFDGTIVGSLSALSSWQNDLGHPTGARLGLLNAMSSITGCLIGPFNAYVCDRFGRRWPLRIYGMTMTLGTIVGVCAGTQAGTGGYVMFLISKGIIGAGMQMGLVTAMICLQEITHPRHRVVCAAIFDPCWSLGSFLATIIIYGTSRAFTSSWSWRVPYLIQVPLAAYVLFATFLIPETPRFLISKGRNDEALAFLVKYHGNGDPNDELVKFEYEEMVQTIAAEKEAAGQTWSQVWNAPGNKHRFGLAALMTFVPQLNGNAVISFYYTNMLKLVGISGAQTLLGINAGLLFFKFFVMIGVSAALPKMRRRLTVLVTWPMMTVAMAGIMGASAAYAASGKTNHHAAIATVAMVWVYSGLESVPAPVFYSYPAEMLNYATRAKGMAIWSVVNQCCGIFSSFVNSIGLNNIGYKYYAFYVALLPCQWLLMYIYMVETKGYTLEEIAYVFEGDQAAVAGVVHSGEASESDSEKKVAV
ncbi:hypothetical protein MNV49_001790 [Pseudohyphozyma bogoriensis]|nr:hypothetical protein MNV49_001790 [Pseudohyphozyma bogoriensis]